MDNHLIYYLHLITKLNDILKYINDNFKDNNNFKEGDNFERDSITSYIIECKSLCINKLKNEPLMGIFLEEIKNENKLNELNQIEKLEELELIKSKDTHIKEKINNLSTLITGETDNITPEIFDTFGSGLARLFSAQSITEPLKDINIEKEQIKNEINLVNTNINCKIKKKYEQ
jgi:hypothetical protein